MRLASLVCLLACACSTPSRAPVESEPCARIGDPCRLPDGPMGVCNETTAPCDDPPCVACFSQH